MRSVSTWGNMTLVVGVAAAAALYGCGSGSGAQATPLSARAAVATPAPLAAGSASTPASSTTVGTTTLSPQAVSLANPVTAGGRGTARRIGVSLSVLSTAGKPLTRGRFSTPIQIRVYGPAAAVLTAETSVIRAPAKTIYFRYDGGVVANPIVVTAVSGHAFAQMSFQPQHRGFPGTSAVAFSMPDRARNFSRGWGFSASIGGGPSHHVEMDTGSRGLVVPASVLGPSAVGPGAAGKIEYSSDGKIFSGHFYLAPVTLRAGAGHATTVPMRVLAVDKASCDPKYPNCKVGGINGLGVMGVGFDRGKPSSMPPELTNAFLALKSVIQGSMHPGYVISATRVTLGVTTSEEAGFSKLSLASGGTGPGDWNTAPGCFSFPRISGYHRQCGTVLVDTGIASAILGLPRAQRPPSIAASIPNGERVSITIGPGRSATPILSYGFAVGDQGATTPTSIRWAGGSSPFINTGRRILSRYDYLFDAASGKLGFKPA